MSFDIYLECMNGDEFCTFPRALVDQYLGPSAKPVDDETWALSFPDGSSGQLFFQEESPGLITGFAINRPSGVALYDAIFEIMSRTSTVLFWGGGAAVADAATIPKLVPELVEEVGEVGVVANGSELAEWVQTH